MFITIRFGNDSKEIFNPDCRIVHLMIEIRSKCKVEEKQIVDLTDETGVSRLSLAEGDSEMTFSVFESSCHLLLPV